jgi:hypothetical protein
MQKRDYGERLQELAVRIINMADSLPDTVVGKHIGSAGASKRHFGRGELLRSLRG